MKILAVAGRTGGIWAVTVIRPQLPVKGAGFVMVGDAMRQVSSRKLHRAYMMACESPTTPVAVH